jgi:DNA-binding CsgD family transcriptional regulator/tetratricopeptide (TPR) repeat protein
LGIIIYQLFTGTLPFKGKDIHSIVHQHLTKSPKPLIHLNSEIPVIVNEIVLKLLEKNSANRYQSAKGLLADITKFKQGERNFSLCQHDIIRKFDFYTKFLGREKELAILEKSLSGALKGRGAFCLISGKSGIGKTRLVEELRQHSCDMKMVTFIQGKCVAREIKTPYWPLSRALDVYLRKFNDYPVEKKRNIQKKIIEVIGDRGEIILRINPALCDLLGACPPIAPLEPGYENQRVLVTIADFIFGLSKIENGLVIVLDDLQWSDETTIAILLELQKRINQQPLLIIGIFRDEEVGLAHGVMSFLRVSLEKKHPLIRIILKPFTQGLMRQFVAEILRKDYTNNEISELSAFIFDKSHGNPFFAREIFKQLIDEKAVYYNQNNQLAIENDILKKLEIPVTIIDCLVKQISLLEDYEQHVISIAAVIGKHFTIPFLLEIGKGYIDENFQLKDEFNQHIVDIITRSISLDLITEDKNEKGSYNFMHDVVREAFYARIDEEERKKLHKKIVKALENIHAADLKNDIWHCPAIFDLAFHSFEIGDPQRIIKYALPAGVAAKNNYAYKDALNYFLWTVKILEGDNKSEKWFEINRTLGEIYVITGNNDKAIFLLNQMAPLVKSRIERAAIFHLISQSYWNKGDVKLCEKYCVIGLHELGENVPGKRIIIVISLIRNLLAHYFYPFFSKIFKRNARVDEEKTKIWLYFILCRVLVTHDHILMIRSILRMLNIAETKIGKSRELGIALLGWGVINLFISRHTAALNLFFNVIPIQKELNDEKGRAIALQFIAYCYYSKLELNAAEKAINMSIEILERIGDLKEINTSLYVKLIISYMKNNYMETMEIADYYYSMAQRIDDHEAKAYALIYSGIIYFYQNEYYNAENYLLEASDLCLKYELWQAMMYLSIQLAELYWEMGTDNKSLEYIEKARNIYEKESFRPITSNYIFLAIAELSIRYYEYQLSDINFDKNKAAFKKIKKDCRMAYKMNKSSLIFKGDSLRIMALYYALYGDIKKAESFFLRAIDHNVKYELKEFSIKSCFDYGLMLKKKGREKQAYGFLVQAYEISIGINHKHYMKKIKELIDIPKHDVPAIDNNIINKKNLEKRYTFIADLLELTRSNTSAENIAGRALEYALKLSGADKGFLIETDDQGNMRVVTGKTTDDEKDPEYQFSYKIVNKTITDKKTVVATKTEENNFNADLIESDSVSRGPVSVLSVPLIVNEKIIGVCYLENIFLLDALNTEDVEAIKTITSIVAIAFSAQVFHRDTDGPRAIEPSTSFCKRFGITKREKEVILLIIKGCSYTEIARELSISSNTVENHKSNIYSKLKINKKRELIDLIMKN